MLDGTRLPIAMMTAALISALGGAPLTAEDCPAFLLRVEPRGFRLDKVVIPEGEMQVWTSGEQPDLVDVVLPVGPGVSGSVASTAPGGLHLVRCAGGEIRRESRAPGGRSSELPARPLAELRLYDVRVSVVGPDGEAAAFVIAEYERVLEDAGPVQNLFAGQPIPLSEHDYVVTTDTYRHSAGPETRGEIAVELAGHPFALGSSPGGAEGWFLVDLGGAETLVARSFLPAGAVVEESRMVEYSAAGRRLLDYAPGGATGQVMGIVGHAELASLRFGDLEFTGARVAVIDEMPPLFDRPVAGILGIDLLRRGGRLVLEFPPGAEGRGRVRLGGDAIPRARGAAAEVPFSILQGHLVLPLSVNETPASFILDTGAPGPLLDVEAARAAGVAPAEGSGREIGGIDGGRAASSSGVIRSLTVGGEEHRDVPCRIAELRAFATLRGGGQRVGLLGNSFLGRFGRVEIDFERHRIHFVR